MVQMARRRPVEAVSGALSLCLSFGALGATCNEPQDIHKRASLDKKGAPLVTWLDMSRLA